jgi:hypothetical protein
MVANMCGKEVHSHHDDEIMYVFNPTKQSYNNNMKNILLWTSSREEERAWANRVGLVGMIEIEWKTPHHNILVEFLNIIESRLCWGRSKKNRQACLGRSY